jgi:hypothetical protein
MCRHEAISIGKFNLSSISICNNIPQIKFLRLLKTNFEKLWVTVEILFVNVQQV